jgi:hypothetical protein
MPGLQNDDGTYYVTVDRHKERISIWTDGWHSVYECKLLIALLQDAVQGAEEYRRKKEKARHEPGAFTDTWV